MVKYLALKYPKKQIIVRPHPTEDIDKIKNNFKDLTNVNVILKYEAAPWIICAENFIHSGCSTAYIALLNNKLPISFLKKKYEKLKRTVPYNLISRIKTDLNVVLNDINNKKKLIKLSKYKKGFSKFVEILDNKTHLVVLTKI